MITSKITSRARTTLPRAVRAALNLREGDEIAYLIDDMRVILSKNDAQRIGAPFTVFAEWNGDTDRKAYEDL